MLTPSITPVRLLRDSLISVIPIYTSLLVFIIPIFILFLLQFVIPKIWFTVLGSLYYLSIGTISYVALIFFSYKKLNQEEVTISQALQKATEKFSEMLIVEIFRRSLLLLLPRFYFVQYLVIIKDVPVADAFRQSWQLTRGYGWYILWNLLALRIIMNTILFISSLISASIFGVSVWELNQGGLLTAHPAFVFEQLLIIAIYFFIYNPVSTIYKMLMFVRLLALEKRNLGSSAM